MCHWSVGRSRLAPGGALKGLTCGSAGPSAGCASRLTDWFPCVGDGALAVARCIAKCDSFRDWPAIDEQYLTCEDRPIVRRPESTAVSPVEIMPGMHWPRICLLQTCGHWQRQGSSTGYVASSRPGALPIPREIGDGSLTSGYAWACRLGRLEMSVPVRVLFGPAMAPDGFRQQVMGPTNRKKI